MLSVLCMTILLGFAALAVDVGALFRAKRNLQIAADAAATAGALDYLYNGSSTSAKTAAKAASGQNGYTDGTGGVTVTVNLPPGSGPNTGSTGYVEAIVSSPNPTYFMKLFNLSSVTVSARAVAGTPTAGGPCIWLMNTSGNGLTLQGSYDIEASNCGIYVNSDTSDAIGVTGGGGTMNALYLDVVGNSTLQHQTSPTTATMNAAPRSNPFGGLTGPTASNSWQGCGTTSTATTITGTVTGPGFTSVTCYTNAVTISNATLGAGLYVFENGVSISGNVQVNGGTIDVENGSFNQGNGTLQLTAPTSDAYNGIAIMQPPGNTNQLQIQFGSSTETLDGMIYAPGAQVYLQDHGGGVTATGIVAASMYDKSSVIDVPNYNVVHASTSPFRVVTMVE